MTRFAALVMLVAITACAEPVSPEPLGDYAAWPAMGGATFTVRGTAPGHGDTVRVIYVNPTARMAESISPTYPLGSTIVKEIRDNDGGDGGEIRYLAIMRLVTPTDTALTDEGGWLYSEQRPPGADEVHFGYCWARCHAAAPYNGAFYDYRDR